MKRQSVSFVLAALTLVPSLAAAQTNPGREMRRASDADLVIDFERHELPNGLVLLLSPDRRMESVLVDMSFAAGSYYEPPGRTGLAHIVEHLLYRGAREGTDYDVILEKRGARSIEAYTSAERMLFRTEVPAQELPLALWVSADRLRTLPDLIREEELPRHLSVVGMEKLFRYADRPYEASNTVIQKILFPKDHPLRHGVIGVQEDWDKITLQDVKGFINNCMHASNAVLTIVGNFDPKTAHQWALDTVGTLPRGNKPKRRSWKEVEPKGHQLSVKERVSRQPKVTLLWHFPEMAEAAIVPLEFGAQLLSNYVDGAFGTQVHAVMQRHDDGASFRLDVTLPYDKPIDAAQREAEVFMRYITGVDVPRELWNLTRLVVELTILNAIDSPIGRAQFLTGSELRYGDPKSGVADLKRHWALTRQSVRHAAWEYLVRGPPRSTIHSRPIRPRKAKLHWEDRDL